MSKRAAVNTVSGGLKWRRIDRVEKIYETEVFEFGDRLFRIEPEWRWSDRKGQRIQDGWSAYAGRGPTRGWLGSYDTLAEAKARCEREAGES